MYLNTKSEYDFLHSLIKLDDYIQFCINNHQAFISICDTNTFGCYKLITLAQKHNLHPVVGLEITISNQQLFLYAKNIKGLQRLFHLNTLQLNDQPIILSEEEDLICIVAKGYIQDQILKNDFSLYHQLTDIFDQLYLGITSEQVPLFFKFKEVIEAQKVKTIDISEKTFLYVSQLNSMETLNAMRNHTNVSMQKRFRRNLQTKCLSATYDFPFADYSQEVAISCNYNLDEMHAPKPKYQFIPDNMSDIDYLYRLSLKGLQKRLLGKVDNHYLERLKFELKTIDQLGYASYFLIVWDIVKFAKSNNIMVGPSRGSAAGCLVAYSIGITNIDPIKHDLLFERFLNPMRKTMPDIDLDFEDVRRNDVYDYIAKRFGVEHVCKIGTINRFLVKSAFRDVAKANGFSLDLIDKVAKSLNVYQSFEENTLENANLKDILISHPEIEILTPIIKDIEGLAHQTSIHAAGIIISAESIDQYCAVNHELVSLQEANELEQMGLLKMDILALSNLTFIRQIVDDVKIDNPDFDLNNIPLNDQKTFDLLCSALTLGVFQIDSVGMREALGYIQPRNMDDIALTLALYRPGPKGFIPHYQSFKQKFKVRNEVDKILQSTSGIIVYQEQIMQLAQLVAGYDLGRADILRRGISKKDASMIKSIREDFIKASLTRGYQEDYVNGIFDQIEKFAGYGFNKAHAYGYALIVYQMAYLKAHYPLIFYARLFYYTFKSNKRDEFLIELVKNNITLLPPSILYSSLEVSIEPNALRMGLLTVKGIGIEQAKAIIQARQELGLEPTIEEVMMKIVAKVKLTKQQVINLVNASAFDFLKYNHQTLINNLTKFCEIDVVDLLEFGGEIAIDELEEYSEEELSDREFQALDINLQYDLFKKLLPEYQNKYKRKVALLDDVINRKLSGKFLVLVHINMFKETLTKNNEPMCFLQVQSKGIYDLVVFPKVYDKYQGIIKSSIGKYVCCVINCYDDNKIVEGIYE